jgi:hypothetical protein
MWHTYTQMLSVSFGVTIIDHLLEVSQTSGRVI